MPVSALVLATPDGGLWIGFTYGGVAFLKDGRVTSYNEPRDLLGAGTVDKFIVGPDGAVWLVSVGGLGRFDGSHWQFIKSDWGYPGDPSRTLFVDRDGTFWVASKDALFFLLRGKHKFQKRAEHLGSITLIGQTPDGTLWLSQLVAPHSEPAWTVRTVRPTQVLPSASQTGPSCCSRVQPPDVLTMLLRSSRTTSAAPDGALLRVLVVVPCAGRRAPKMIRNAESAMPSQSTTNVANLQLIVASAASDGTPFGITIGAGSAAPIPRSTSSKS